MNIGNYNKVRQAMKTYNISNCAIRSENCVYITFEDHKDGDENADVKFCVGFFYPKTEYVWGGDLFTNVYRGQSCVIPGGSAVVADFNGQILSQTGETSKETKFKFEKRLPLIPQISVMQLRVIDGKAYMAGSLRTVFRREGRDNWTCLSGNDTAVRDKADKENRLLGFEDIDGFSADDIYACGGQGDICHYDGKQWAEMPCPTNIDLMSICCAGNGKVYAGGIEGYLIEGRDDNWKVVSKDTGLWINSLAWYKDKLYMATGQGLYEYQDGKITKTPGLSGLSLGQNDETESQKRVKKMLVKGGTAEDTVDFATSVSVPDEGILAPSGLHTLSTDGDLLVLGGHDGVIVFNGETWKTLYSPYDDKGGFLDF